MSQIDYKNDLKKQQILAQLARELDRMTGEKRPGEVAVKVNITSEGVIAGAVMDTGKVKIA